MEGPSPFDNRLYRAVSRIGNPQKLARHRVAEPLPVTNRRYVVADRQLSVTVCRATAQRRLATGAT